MLVRCDLSGADGLLSRAWSCRGRNDDGDEDDDDDENDDDGMSDNGEPLQSYMPSIIKSDDKTVRIV